MEGKSTKICFSCGSTMEACTTTATFSYHGKEIEIKGIAAYRCPICGEEVYTSEEAKMIEKLMQTLSEMDVPKIDILNLDETAQYLRVSNQTVYNMIKDGRIKAHKIGREWRFLRGDIVTYMNSTATKDVLSMAAKGGSISKNDLDVIRNVLGDKE